MPSTSGTYYIDVSDPEATTPENYTVSVAAVVADYTDNPSAPGSVAISGSTTGTLANIGQHDWIAISLVGDQAYEVTINGLTNDASVTVQNATGVDVPGGENTTLTGDFTVANNYTYFMPSTSGTYYIDVSDPEATTPENYTVSVAAVVADYTDNPSTSGLVIAGGGIQKAVVGATIEPFADLNITDLSNQTETVIVQPSNATYGVLSNLGSGTYNSTTDQYTVSGSASAVTTALDSLSFTPTVSQTSGGQPALTTFQISVVDAGGATAQDTSISVQALPCFVIGTRIDTDLGSVPVECLRAGDRARSSFGGARSVTWIGYRHLDCRRHPDPRKVWPVQIVAGAFSDGIPHRSLRISPDHAVFVNDVLIPIKHLINGVSITQVPVDNVTYYHIELSQHDVLLAEGLPTESYLDTGDRSSFANGGKTIRLIPEFSTPSLNAAATWEALGCARLVGYGPELITVRQRLEERACRILSTIAPRNRTRCNGEVM
jgi:DNA gyrase inhibitor GyrI